MICVVATETNGREDMPEVIELAWTELEEGSWAIGEGRYAQRFCPQLPSTVGALSIHHILMEELKDCPPSIEAKLPSEITYIIGHNVDYDWEALGKPEVKRIDTLAISRNLYPQLDSHRLGAMLYHLIDDGDARTLMHNAHNAEGDVTMCIIVLQTILLDNDLLFETAEDLWLFSEKCRVPTHMPFGKHRGCPIKDLPWSYKSWCLRQPDMDPYVLQAIREAM